MLRRIAPRFALVMALALPAMALPSFAASTPLTPGKDARPVVEFSVEASQSAPNDLGVARLYAEDSGSNATQLAADINQRIAKALELAGSFASVKPQSDGISTWPVYAKDGQGRITSWRMRAEIRIESQDLGALSELIGRLQSTLALSHVSMQPAPETRRKTIETATVSAIRAFEQRAALIAQTLGRRYRITQMTIGDSGFHPPMPVRMRAAPAMMADAAPAPLEGGESQLGVTISGRIELLD